MKILVITGLPGCYPRGVRVATHKDTETERDIVLDTCDSMGLPPRKTLRGLIGILRTEHPKADAHIEEIL